MAESIAAGTETVPRHRGPHYLCPQCRDINPLHLNARRARSAYSSRFPSTARAPRRGGEKSREAGRRRGGRRDIRRTAALYLTLHTGASSSASSCARGVVPLVLEFSETSGVRVGRLPRSADALEFPTSVFYLQYK